MQEILNQLVIGASLTRDQTQALFERIMTGQVREAQVAALLAMIQMRGPTEDELTGAARVMRDKATAVTAPDGLTVIDTCGTGGDHSGTFNISTAAAIVAAAAGRPHGVAVAKHGNRSVTSKSGSSQVLEALGVKLKVSGETLTRCLDDPGICFCFAPAHHPAMKHAMNVRRELGFRTIFNLLGPLSNPAGAQRQVIGVFSEALTEPIARVLGNLGSQHAMVVHGRIDPHGLDSASKATGGLDELTITGPSRITHLREGQIDTYEIEPSALGLETAEIESLRVDGPEDSARVIRGVLSGQKGPARDIVCLNTAAALVVAEVAADLQEGLSMAQKSIDSGNAKDGLEKLIQITQFDPTQ